MSWYKRQRKGQSDKDIRCWQFQLCISCVYRWYTRCKLNAILGQTLHTLHSQGTRHIIKRQLSAWSGRRGARSVMPASASETFSDLLTQANNRELLRLSKISDKTWAMWQNCVKLFSTNRVKIISTNLFHGCGASIFVESRVSRLQALYFISYSCRRTY